MRAGLYPVAFLLLIATFPPGCAQGQQREADAGDEVQLDSIIARADRSRVKGAEDAPVTIVEISDFQCPFCARFATETLPQIDSAYIETGKVRMIFVNYPLPNHPQAWTASKTALCAGAQGKFWPVHDGLFAAQQDWSGQTRPLAHHQEIARDAGVEMESFRTCMANDLVASILVNDLMQGARSGVTGTPTFFLGPERAVAGHLSFEEMSGHIEELLATEGANGEETGGEGDEEETEETT
ncbi:MAG: DsbA family protein [Longimicrobiaceae bacterium]